LLELRFLAQREGLGRVLELEPAAREIGAGVALQFKRDRFGEPVEPELATHAPLHAIVNLTADYAVMNAPGHARRIIPPARQGKMISERIIFDRMIDGRMMLRLGPWDPGQKLEPFRSPQRRPCRNARAFKPLRNSMVGSSLFCHQLFCHFLRRLVR
jgi:hypothetical protein